jgi:hypothetical protein
MRDFSCREDWQDANEQQEWTEAAAVIECASLRVHTLLLSRYGVELNEYIEIGQMAQGGLAYVTPVHFAAMKGDLGLCQLLKIRGANINANIFIPNDQHSQDTSEEAANRDDGYDFSQYRWGTITPLRIAITFGFDDIARFLEANGGKPSTAIKASFRPRIGSVFKILPRLPTNGCWVDQERKQLLVKNTYMHGDRVYPEIIFCDDMESTIVNLLPDC